MSDLFKRASRLKLRFDSKVGKLSTEDLWDLPLNSRNKANLNDVARGIARKLKESEEEDFVGSSNTNSEDNLRLDIVKEIIRIRLEEKDKAEARKAKESQKETIKQILAQKEHQELLDKSPEELQEMLKD